MRLLTLVFVLFVSSGCAHQIKLPVTSYEECNFIVTDKRTDSDHVYAKGQAVVKIKVIPKLSDAIQSEVCYKIGQNDKYAEFIITDFYCIVSGFVKMTYLVDLRGTLVSKDIGTKDIQTGAIVESHNGYVPAGCELATSQAFPDIVGKIVEALE